MTDPLDADRQYDAVERIIEERDKARAEVERWKRVAWHALTGWCNNEPRPSVPPIVDDDLKSLEHALRINEKP